jgi:hypothetical protein
MQNKFIDIFPNPMAAKTLESPKWPAALKLIIYVEKNKSEAIIAGIANLNASFVMYQNESSCLFYFNNSKVLTESLVL